MSAPLQALADACVAQLDPFRAPPSDAELARRRRSAADAEQDAMLVRWGYPYVFETWFFHMTLTRRLNADGEGACIMPAAEAHFARALAVPRRVEDICLFVQPAPGEPFVIAERSEAARLTARDRADARLPPTSVRFAAQPHKRRGSFCLSCPPPFHPGRVRQHRPVASSQ